jgi:hypothetical protein
MPLSRRVIILGLIAAVSVTLRLLRPLLQDVLADTWIDEAPGNLTRGAYWAFAVSSAACIAHHYRDIRTARGLLSRHAIFFILATFLSFDVVVNSYRETALGKEATYGLVVAADFLAAAFIMVALLFYLPPAHPGIDTSVALRLAPGVAIWRHMAHQEHIFDPGVATFDMLVLFGIVLAWVVFDADDPPQRHTFVLKCMMLTGLLYVVAAVSLGAAASLLALHPEENLPWFPSGVAFNALLLALATAAAVSLVRLRPQIRDAVLAHCQ